MDKESQKMFCVLWVLISGNADPEQTVESLLEEIFGLSLEACALFR